MKHRLSALALFPLIAVACAPAADVEADRAAIEAVREAEGAAFGAGNVDAVMDVFTDDIVFMSPNEPLVSGRDAVREWANGFTSMFTVTIHSYETDEIEVAGDMAYERYTAHWTITPKDGGDAVEEILKGIHIFRRQADGSWKIAQDIWNSDEPLPGM